MCFRKCFRPWTARSSSDAKLIHIDLDAFEIAKNHPVTVGLVSDPKLTLKSLADAVTDLASPAQREAAARRSQAIGEANRKAMADARAQDEKWRDAVPLHMSAFAQELARQLPKDAIVFDEVADPLAGADPLAEARSARPVFPDSWRFPGGRYSRGDRYQTGAPRTHRHRLKR